MDLNTYTSPIQRAQAFRAQNENLAASKQVRQQSSEMFPIQKERGQLANDATKAEIARITETNNITSMAKGAMEFSQIDPNDLQAQNQFLLNRVAEIESRGGDARDTKGMLTLPPAQRYEAAKKVLEIAQAMGVLKAPEQVKQATPVSWQTQQVVGPDGNQMMIQVNPQTGETRPIEGYAPPPKSGESIYVNPETGTVEINRGPNAGTSGSGMSRTTQGKIEGKLVALNEQRQMLDAVQADFDPTALTFAGKLSNAFSGFKEKLGGTLTPEQADAQKRIVKFTNGVEQLFNAYRKEITGAAASVQELDRLKDSMINKDLSPTQFQAAWEQFSDQINRGTDLYANMLENGISPETAARAVDEQFKSSVKSREPDIPVPEGIDPKDWEFMSEDDRKLFQ